jgi:NitT/TauT family transport system permease protein
MDPHANNISDDNQKHRFWYGSIAFMAIVILWEGIARFSGWSAHIFPDPVTVVTSLVELAMNGTLIRHTVASLFRVTVGFYLAILFGIPLGILLGRMRSFRWLLNPVIQFLRPISPLAWIPLAMLWFGIGDRPAIFLIFLSSFFPLVVSTIIAVENINPSFFQVAANFNFSRRETLVKLILPAIMPEVITASATDHHHCMAGGGCRRDDCRPVRSGISDIGCPQCTADGLCHGWDDCHRSDRIAAGLSDETARRD